MKINIGDKQPIKCVHCKGNRGYKTLDDGVVYEMKYYTKDGILNKDFMLELTKNAYCKKCGRELPFYVIISNEKIG